MKIHVAFFLEKIDLPKIRFILTFISAYAGKLNSNPQQLVDHFFCGAEILNRINGFGTCLKTTGTKTGMGTGTKMEPIMGAGSTILLTHKILPRINSNQEILFN